MLRYIFLLITILSVVTVAHSAPKVLIVVSNISLIPGTMEKTGVWAEELVVPYEMFKEAGFEVALASPKGGEAVFDERSLDPRVVADKEIRLKTLQFKIRYAHLMRNTIHLSEVRGVEYDALFVPGGHGVMFDVATCSTLAKLTVQFLRQGKIVGSVCHGPCFLATARDRKGRYAVAGYEVTGFSNEEEVGVAMVEKMPFSLEDELQKASGGLYSRGPAWQSYVLKDKNLVTGQNPASSKDAAQKVIDLLLSPGKEQWLEAFVEESFQKAIRRPFKSTKGAGLPVNVVLDASPKRTTWDTGHVVVHLGRRKKNVKRRIFLPLLKKHIKHGLRLLKGKGLRGYMVLATKDYELAYLQWRSEAHMTRVLSSKKGKAMVAEAASFMDSALWKQARKYPTWLQR